MESSVRSSLLLSHSNSSNIKSCYSSQKAIILTGNICVCNLFLSNLFLFNMSEFQKIFKQVLFGENIIL